jgi:hypothetical protein
MEDWRWKIRERAELFAAENGRTLIGQLGYGHDGNVFATERQSAIKVLRFQHSTNANEMFTSGCDLDRLSTLPDSPSRS